MEDKEKQDYTQVQARLLAKHLIEGENRQKEKQIEEIKQIIDYRCEAELGQVHASSMNGKVTKTVGTNLIAKDIYNAGYQKIDKDSIVLSKDDYEAMQTERQNLVDKYNQADEAVDYWCEKFKKASKETPEKIIDVDKAIETTKQKAIKGFVNKLLGIFANAMGICSGCVSQHDKAQNQIAKNFYLGEYKGFELAVKEVKELAKQFGVEIKE